MLKNMNRILLLILLLSVHGSLFAEAYRIVHPDGSIEFTDEPVDGAEPVQLEQPSTYTYTPPAPLPTLPAEVNPAAQAPAPLPEGEDANFKYKKLQIVSPANDSTVVANDNRLQVAVLVDPQLRSEHQVVLSLDGQVQAKGGGVFVLEGVLRGTHSLQAKVVDAKGKTLITSPITKVHVQHQFRKQGEADPLNGVPGGTVPRLTYPGLSAR